MFFLFSMIFVNICIKICYKLLVFDCYTSIDVYMFFENKISFFEL